MAKQNTNLGMAYAQLQFGLGLLEEALTLGLVKDRKSKLFPKGILESAKLHLQAAVGALESNKRGGIKPCH